MSGAEIDYAAVFAVAPSPLLLLAPDLVILDANQAFASILGVQREELLGRYVFDVLPRDPSDPENSGLLNLEASLRRVLATGERDSIALQEYDMEAPGHPGVFEQRWWTSVNTPVKGPDGKVALILHRVEEVTPLVREHERRGLRGDEPGMAVMAIESELYIRAREVQELNERLHQAHARERETALALQQAMLPVTAPGRHPGTAVRYRPALGALNVCGDWYDVVDLDEGRLAVAVGDVVGQGLRAAGVMGQLRSALSAAIRTVEGPARALEILGLYARSVEGALAATAVLTVIDPVPHTITYSCAGHLPPMLAHTDGTIELLDQATDPPLGSRPVHVPRPQSCTTYAPGETLVLYTDGLVERRGEDIDVGLGRLADSLAGNRALAPEPLADALLADLGATSGTGDDTALVVVSLS